LTLLAERATLAAGLNRWEGTVDDDRARPPSVAGRRGVLRNLLVLGAAAPLAGVLPGKAAQAAPGPAGLSSLQLAGQRVIYSYPGLTVPAALLQAITAGQAAGVIFFGPNISSEAQIASVIQQLAQAQQQSPVSAPLLLMTDQEGGEVRRLPGAPVMSEKQIGQSSDPAAAASSAGTGAGLNLAGVGVNVNLAPVLDVYYKSGNFIDEFQRSYSSKATVVTACGQAFITAQQQTGVAATAKHFPGLGSATTSQDTDTGPVTLPVSLSELRSKDEAPYPAAIAAGVQLIMVSWAIYPALDATNPAGLSSAVVQGELRGRLGYQGVTITDALEAGALTAFGSSGQRALLAAQAGMDLLLCAAQDPSQGQAVTSALASALDSGQLGSAAFDAAVQRVTALRGLAR
jgi:beta-N-acetylhexosaminidase